MRLLALVALSLAVFTPALAAQETPAGPQASSACTYDDGTQVSVRYNSSAAGHEKELPSGKLFPAGEPMFLFTQTETTLGGSTIPIGAFSMYVIPGKGNWTLVVNRNVTPGAKYDEAQDLARAPMQTAPLERPLDELKVSLGHLAPKRCEVRVYYGKVGAWAELQEK
ncbi:MAG TPA: DUF2911 domain-containing protein [Terriglobales bacterium]|nr:DUF2911 domain-containing protein [Terriglobales bacterium]